MENPLPTSKQKLVAILLSVPFFAAPIEAAPAAEVTPEEQQIDALSYDILHKEIDLERYYLHYRVKGTEQPKWRRLRYYALQVASTSTGLACNIIFTKLAKEGLKAPGVQNFGKGDADTDDTPETAQEAANDFEAPEVAAPQTQGSNGPVGGGALSTQARSTNSSNSSGTANRITPNESSDASEPDTNNQVKAAFVLNTISTGLDGASNTIELGSNLLTCLKNKKLKTDPASTVNNVIARIKEIDQLILERDSIVQKNPFLPEAPIYQAEGRVLKAFRNWCLSEFADVYAEVKSTQSSSNVYYVLALAADAMYLTGSILGLRALSPGKDNLNGPAIINSIVGDSIYMSSVPVSTVAGSLLYKYHRNKLEDKLKQELENNEPDAKAAMAQLNKVIQSADIKTLRRARSIQVRASAYLLWAGRYDRYIDKELVELRHQSKVAHQGEVSGPVLSGSFLATDILAAIGFYRFPNDARRGSSLAYAGSIASTSASSTSLFLTNYNLFSEILHRRKLKKQGILPEQLLAERFQTLDQLDIMIRPKGSSEKL